MPLPNLCLPANQPTETRPYIWRSPIICEGATERRAARVFTAPVSINKKKTQQTPLPSKTYLCTKFGSTGCALFSFGLAEIKFITSPRRGRAHYCAYVRQQRGGTHSLFSRLSCTTRFAGPALHPFLSFSPVCTTCCTPFLHFLLCTAVFFFFCLPCSFLRSFIGLHYSLALLTLHCLFFTRF